MWDATGRWKNGSSLTFSTDFSPHTLAHTNTQSSHPCSLVVFPLRSQDSQSCQALTTYRKGNPGLHLGTTQWYTHTPPHLTTDTPSLQTVTHTLSFLHSPPLSLSIYTVCLSVSQQALNTTTSEMQAWLVLLPSYTTSPPRPSCGLLLLTTVNNETQKALYFKINRSSFTYLTASIYDKGKDIQLDGDTAAWQR